MMWLPWIRATSWHRSYDNWAASGFRRSCIRLRNLRNREGGGRLLLEYLCHNHVLDKDRRFSSLCWVVYIIICMKVLGPTCLTRDYYIVISLEQTRQTLCHIYQVLKHPRPFASRDDKRSPDKQPYANPEQALSDAQSRDVQFRSTINSNPNFDPPDIDNSTPSANSTHAVKMRYIHSEERLPIPDNGELSTFSCFSEGMRFGGSGMMVCVGRWWEIVAPLFVDMGRP